jgi:DNA-binding SARP family transcriptional activator
LRLLGRFSAGTAGPSPQMMPISAPRHRVLLAYLAMQSTYAETRERLATLLWSDRADKQARQSLRQLLLTFRQELETAGIDLLRVGA